MSRNRTLIRTWNILALLREKPRTMAQLATACGVHERTIRRDLDALRAVHFPISVKNGRWWLLAPMEAWPLNERAPVETIGPAEELS